MHSKVMQRFGSPVKPSPGAYWPSRRLACCTGCAKSRRGIVKNVNPSCDNQRKQEA